MKRALVTGGTRGIGLAVCRLLVEKGYEVTALYAGGKDLAEAQKALPQVHFLRADVAREQDVSAVFSQISSLDLRVNNAGGCAFAQVQDITAEEYARVMNINAGGQIL
ncbi:MAG: SDR family oxidoreductase, partial [Clostridia bacterium]|nr:SDR family oxidoreductase [Clostridia bacterium]